MAESEREKVRRVRRSVAEKRRIVEETLVPGASVARIARERGVNANQVFAWRRLYKAGRLGKAAEAGALLAVRVGPDAAAPGGRRAARSGGGAIVVELRRGWLRIEGGADATLLRIVLEHLAG